MKHVYELYTEWTKGRSRVAEGGIFKTVSECELEAFQAGFLAAADIVQQQILLKQSGRLRNETV